MGAASDIKDLRDVAIDRRARGPAERGLDHEVGQAGFVIGARLGGGPALGLGDGLAAYETSPCLW